MASRALLVVLLGAAVLAAAGAARDGANPFVGAKWFVDPASPAARQVEAWRRTRPADAAQLAKISTQPQAVWLTTGEDVYARTRERVAEMAAAGAISLLTLYYIPHRDCGLYSTGGAPSAAAYRTWVDDVARAIGGHRAAVVLEPDALASIGPDCLTAARQKERLGLLRYAVQRLVRLPGTAVYIDAGHAAWRREEEIADLLRRAGVEMARGFSLNVAGFQSTPATVEYGRRISRLVAGKHFVIDTGRNGRGALPRRLWKKPEDGWCNSPGRALGARPTTHTADPLADAYLWIKAPGQSDGSCNGGPPPDAWWPEYALGLARRAAY